MMARKMPYRKRAKRISEKGTFLLTDESNILYVAGTSAASFLILPQDGSPVVIAPRLEADRAKEESWIRDVRCFYQGEIPLRRGERCTRNVGLSVVKSILDETGVKEVFFDHLDHASYSSLLSFHPRPSDVVAEERMIKEPEEIRLLEKAREVAGEAYLEVSSEMGEDVTELQLAGRIYQAVMSRGASCSFPPIVAFDENTAFPHHPPTKKKLGSSSVVLMDLGARVQGYCSDITRTTLLSPGPAEESLEAVRTSIADVIDKLEAGMPLSKVDGMVRSAIGKAAANFLHSLGHGIGLSVHELPVLGPSSGQRLSEGMVFTIEPGLYYKGRYGVRWEEDVVFVKGRARIMGGAVI